MDRQEAIRELARKKQEAELERLRLLEEAERREGSFTKKSELSECLEQRLKLGLGFFNLVPQNAWLHPSQCNIVLIRTHSFLAFVTTIQDCYAQSHGQAYFECKVKDRKTEVAWYIGNWKEVCSAENVLENCISLCDWWR